MAYQFIQANRYGGSQGRANRVVIHCTVSPTYNYADNIANYFANTSRAASAHYVVDQSHIIQCVREDRIAYHAPPNSNSIGIELCDPQSGSSARWQDANHQDMLRIAAKLTREVARRHGIPLVRLSPADLRAGKRGICGHIDVSLAFKLSDHSNPGSAFPWGQFMELVRNDEEDDLPYSKSELSAIVSEAVWEHQIAVPEYGEQEHPGVDSISAGGWLRGAEIKTDNARSNTSAILAKQAELGAKYDELRAQVLDLHAKLDAVLAKLG